MREDMSKVLVESPRVGRGEARAHEGSRRRRRDRLDRHGEGAPQRMGMRRDAVERKHFGEHLGPLYRYLRAQVNRSWSKVYGELCAGLDRRNVVQAHLFQHLDAKVTTDAVWLDDAVWVRTSWGLLPLAESWVELYVHPRTGILLPNRARVIAAHRRREAREAEAQAPHPDRRSALPGMAPDCQWHRIEGIWYEVRLGALDANESGTCIYDVVLRRPVNGTQRRLLHATYGQGGCCGIAKRQLGGPELRRHGL